MDVHFGVDELTVNIMPRVHETSEHVFFNKLWNILTPRQRYIPLRTLHCSVGIEYRFRDRLTNHIIQRRLQRFTL